MEKKNIHLKPIDILLIEDNLGDVRLTREALRDSKILNTIHTVNDGVEALEFLHKQGKFVDAPHPDIILLDLNMPKMDGREFLGIIKNDLTFKRIPVVILTTSQAEKDILQSYELHANCYISKPVDLDQFITVVRSIEDFWFTIVTLPLE